MATINLKFKTTQEILYIISETLEIYNKFTHEVFMQKYLNHTPTHMSPLNLSTNFQTFFSVGLFVI